MVYCGLRSLQFVPQHRHMLREPKNHLPFHHNVRWQMRRMLESNRKKKAQQRQKKKKREKSASRKDLSEDHDDPSPGRTFAAHQSTSASPGPHVSFADDLEHVEEGMMSLESVCCRITIQSTSHAA